MFLFCGWVDVRHALCTSPPLLVSFEAAFAPSPTPQQMAVVIGQPHWAQPHRICKKQAVSLRRLELNQPDKGVVKRKVNIKSVVVSLRKVF
jgi:hypothetical protein